MSYHKKNSIMKNNMTKLIFFRPQRRSLLVAFAFSVFLAVIIFRESLIQSLGFRELCGRNTFPRDSQTVHKLRLKMERILEDCGDICETRPEKQNVIGRKYFNVIKKNFECKKLFESKVFDEPSLFSIPPDQVCSAYLQYMSTKD